MNKNKQDIQNLLSRLPHTIQVTFALHCCNDIRSLITGPKSLKALEVVEKWLHNPASVTTQELYDAAAAAAYTANATATANAAAYAANAAATASSAYSASASAYAAYSASASAYAVSSAAYAAWACSSSSGASNAEYNVKINQYYNDLVLMLKDLTELEKVLWDIDVYPL